MVTGDTTGTTEISVVAVITHISCSCTTLVQLQKAFIYAGLHSHPIMYRGGYGDVKGGD